MKTELYVHRLAPKKGLGKQCNRETDRIGLILSSSGAVFGSAKSQIPLADASKRCPENNTPNSRRNPVNGHLRLASVVALSSSGACGAIMIPKCGTRGSLVCKISFGSARIPPAIAVTLK